VSHKETYRKLCQERTDIPLFMQAWWLDATPLPWDVILYQPKGQVLGFYVYSYVKKWGKTMIIQPMLTQYSGPFLFLPDGISLTQKYSLENKAYHYFIEQLAAKKYHFIEQNWHYSQQNWQPFYWHGFKESSRYTFVLENLQIDEIRQALSPDKKKKLHKAQALQLRFDTTCQDFYQLYHVQLQAKGTSIFYPFEVFQKLHDAAKQRNQGQIFSLHDEAGNLHAALWVVWDSHTAYHLIIPIHPAYRSSGATTRLIFEALQFLQGKTKQYDFEGSMIQGVALHNQSFGAKQVAFHQIQKSHSKLLSLWRMLKK
jgi:hypothetical protein